MVVFKKLLPAAEPVCFYSFLQEILNHIINDLEIFMGKVSAAANEPSLQNKKSKKKNGVKKKKSKKYGNILSHLISPQAHVINKVISGE